MVLLKEVVKENGNLIGITENDKRISLTEKVKHEKYFIQENEFRQMGITDRDEMFEKSPEIIKERARKDERYILYCLRAQQARGPVIAVQDIYEIRKTDCF